MKQKSQRHREMKTKLI